MLLRNTLQALRERLAAQPPQREINPITGYPPECQALEDVPLVDGVPAAAPGWACDDLGPCFA